MIRLTWRQFRGQAFVAALALVAVAVVFALTGPHLAYLYRVYDKSQAACVASRVCRNESIKIGTLDKLLELIGTALVVVPGLLGAFWGAPLITRELENGTHRLAWTQSVTRARWLATKLAVVGVAAMVASGLLSLMVTWWSTARDRSLADRFNVGLFGERNIVPIGHAAFGLVLGVALGLLIRRTVPAMAATLVAFLAVRLAFSYFVRSHLLGARHATYALDPGNAGFGTTNGGPPTLMPGDPRLSDAWIYTNQYINAAGHAITSQVVAAKCPALVSSVNGPVPDGPSVVQAPGGIGDMLQSCVRSLGATYHQAVTYQPANRYWLFQGVETTVFLAAAVALAAFCVWSIGRKDA